MLAITKKHLVISLILLTATFAVTALVFPHLPRLVVTHYGIDGQPNNWAPRGVGAFVLPCVMLVLFVLLVLVPLAPRAKMNFASIRTRYSQFLSMIILFFMTVQGIILATSLGVPLDVRRFFPVLLGALFIGVGRLIRDVPRNHIMGVRTPWTLENDAVWTKTHRMGGALFPLAGLVAIAGALVPRYAFGVFLGTMLLLLIFLVTYSYVLAKNIRREKPGA